MSLLSLTKSLDTTLLIKGTGTSYLRRLCGSNPKRLFCTLALSLVSTTVIYIHLAPTVSIQGSHRVNWSRFAYVQYATSSAYLCNSLMLFEILDQLGCRADRLMMYPVHWTPRDGAENNHSQASPESRLLTIAQDKFGVRLEPIKVVRRHGGDRKFTLVDCMHNLMLKVCLATWAESYTKLLAFNLTQYARVLSLDSDSVIQKCMDELFLLPPAPVAMPQAYWLWPDQKQMTSALLLIEPNVGAFNSINEAIQNAVSGKFDMDILNDIYFDSVTTLPHREYMLLTHEFVGSNHTAYFGNNYESWDPEQVMIKAKFIHFSDWPFPKVCQSHFCHLGTSTTNTVH